MVCAHARLVFSLCVLFLVVSPACNEDGAGATDNPCESLAYNPYADMEDSLTDDQFAGFQAYQQLEGEWTASLNCYNQEPQDIQVTVTQVKTANVNLVEGDHPDCSEIGRVSFTIGLTGSDDLDLDGFSFPQEGTLYSVPSTDDSPWDEYVLEAAGGMRDSVTDGLEFFRVEVRVDRAGTRTASKFVVSEPTATAGGGVAQTQGEQCRITDWTTAD